MSFPDPTPSPHQFISPPYSGGDAAGFWPSFWQGNENQPQQQQPDLMSQFDHVHAFRKPTTSEKPPNFAPRINQPNLPVNKGTSHIFYKTRICAKFMEGTCRNGEHCTFAHGVEDLREPPPNWQELVQEKDRVSNNWGDDQRMIHRMKICKKYYNGEECPYGEKCNFLHERPSPHEWPSPPMKKLKVDMNGQRESSAISIGITGDARGSSGDFSRTVFWKTKLCSKWEIGQCPFGERCHFAHGQSELRFSGSPDEAEVALNTGPVPRKAASVSAFNTPPANLVVAAPVNADAEKKRISKWKLTKKINHIYADWLDDSSNEED